MNGIFTTIRCPNRYLRWWELIAKWGKKAGTTPVHRKRL